MSKSAVFGEFQPGGMFSVQDFLQMGGNAWFVGSAESGKGDETGKGKNPDYPFATLDYAIGQASAGDTIILLPGHAETYSTTGTKVTIDVIGLRIIAVGRGTKRATFIFSHTGAAWVWSAASVTIENLLFVCGVDSVTAPLTISGTDWAIKNCEWRDTTDVEFVRAFVTTNAADRGLVDGMYYNGYTGGNACVNAIRLIGVDGCEIKNSLFKGLASTAFIEMVTTQCTKIDVHDCLFQNTGTALTKNVVDTGGISSTWAARNCFDLIGGYGFSGGSGAALAGDDISSVTTALATLQAEISGAAGLTSFPAGAAAANGVSTAEVIRYIQENIIRGAGTVLPDAQSLFDILAGANGIATWPAAAAPANGVSLAEGLRYIVETLIGALTNTGGTASLTGIIGDVANITMAARLNSGVKKTTIADGTTIPNNTQDAAGLLATATGGDVLIEEIIWQRAADNFVGPTNYEFSTDNVAGLTGAAAPNVVALLAKFNAQKTCIASIDGATKQLPFVLESTKKLYIHGDDAVTSGGGSTDFYIRYRRLAAGAYLA